MESRLALGFVSVFLWELGGVTGPGQTLKQQSQGPGTYLHISVQADCGKEQALHVLKRYGTLLLIVDKKR